MGGDPSPHSVALRGVDRYLRGLCCLCGSFPSSFDSSTLASTALFHRTRTCASIHGPCQKFTSNLRVWLCSLPSSTPEDVLDIVFTCGVVFIPHHTTRVLPSHPLPGSIGCKGPSSVQIHTSRFHAGRRLCGRHTEWGLHFGSCPDAMAKWHWTDWVGACSRATRHSVRPQFGVGCCEFLLGNLGTGR